MSDERETPADAAVPEADTGAAQQTTPVDQEPSGIVEAGSAAPASAEPADQSGRRAQVDPTASDVQPGAPVEEDLASTTEVLAAVDRAGDLSTDVLAEGGAAPASTTALPGTAEPAPVPAEEPATVAQERAPIAFAEEMPSAGPVVVPPMAPASENKILVSADHPMAALYMQTPMPPDLRGNRGAGVLIALLSTVVFAIVYAGVLALWLAPTTPPSQFVDRLLEFGLWPVIAASVAFFVGLTLVVLVVGRAGWWAYVLGGFLVGALAWAAAVVGNTYALSLLPEGGGLRGMLGAGFDPLAWIAHSGLSIVAVAAGIVAREVTVWFGAWIGARGRRVTRANAEAISEYETALADAQSTQP